MHQIADLTVAGSSPAERTCWWGRLAGLERWFRKPVYASIVGSNPTPTAFFMNITILELPVERWQEYKDLRLTLLKTYPQAYSSTYEENVQRTDDEWKQYLQDNLDDKTILLFAEVDGKVVGSVRAFFYDNPKEKHKASVFAMGVLPEFQGQGVGKKLLSTILEKIKSHPGMIKIDLDVTTTQTSAIHLYESLGFKKVGEYHKELFVDGTYYNLYEMELLLDE